jgi:hypothetical protein
VAAGEEGAAGVQERYLILVRDWLAMKTPLLVKMVDCVRADIWRPQFLSYREE